MELSMPSRLQNARLSLALDSASIVRYEDHERIVFPAIVFGETEAPPTKNLSREDRFQITSAEVQQTAADEARAEFFGHVVDIDENDPTIRVSVSLALPPNEYEVLAKRVTEIKARSLTISIDINENDEVRAMSVDGVPIKIVVRSGYTGLAPAELAVG
jgi:hypothetical protein